VGIENVSEDFKKMKRKILSVAFMALTGMMLSSVASASTVDCSTVNDVTTLTGANNCSVTGASLMFSNFAVSESSGLTSGTVGIGNAVAGTGVFGGEVVLAFQLGGLTWSGATGFGDILMFYEVTPAISGVDLSLQATPAVPGGQMTITEVACDQAFKGTSCNGTTLANFSVTSGGQSASNSAIFPTTGPVFIKKDIQFNGATTSEFENSQLIPEPMSLSLMGAGLLGLGIFGRRRFSK
jgi:hypothetical protein